MTAGTVLSLHPAVDELDRLLTQAAEPSGPFAPACLIDLDRQEAFPADACRLLDDFGLHTYYVPAQYGGRLADFAESMRLTRAVAARDLTVAIAHGKTFLGAVSVWLGGRPQQAAWLGAEVCAGAVVSWGLTERHHGSDLFAGELAAVRTGSGWRLSGEKWLINNATRGELVCVLARTSPTGGPRGFSMFLVDKRRLPADRYRHLDKVYTHGIRGADISGIAFDDAEIPATALVGGVGDGLAITLRALQLTRTACAALSLGAADQALRLAVDFVRGRRLAGRPLAELPPMRRLLGEAAATLLLAEATSLLASRSINALTGEMNVTAAITKAFVPSQVQEMLDTFAEIIGGSGFTAGRPIEEAFEKLHRDHPIVGIFDGSTLVSKNALINQFPRLARSYQDGSPLPWDEAGLREAATVDGHVTEFDPARLSLLSAQGCSVVQALPAAAARLGEQAGTGEVPVGLARMAGQLHATVVGLQRELAEYVPTARDVPAAAFELARRYELCFAGAACVHLWLHNFTASRDEPAAALWRDGLWLRAALARVLDQLGARRERADLAVHDRLAEQLLRHADDRRPFSLLPGPAAVSA